MPLCVCVCMFWGWGVGGWGDELHCIVLTTPIDEFNVHEVVHKWSHKTVAQFAPVLWCYSLTGENVLVHISIKGRHLFFIQLLGK